ncbi:unnamed protein product [Somion occarium]|uniref:Uncharacterized protein n=1 Tax=Somion occarium TaxID=3059160 RepID=A0ABP1DXB5_9APHY
MANPLPSSPRSTESFDSFQGGDDDPESSINGLDSSAALILVPEEEQFDQELSVSFDFSSDDEDEEDDDQFDRLRTSSIPPLTSSAVFLYLFAPLLKLGAILTVDESGTLPLKWAIPALVIFAVLCAFTRQIWFMLAKYVRRADMEEILLQAFARRRGDERKRRIIRTAVRFCTGAFRVLLTVVYLRSSVDVLLPLLPEKLIVPSRYPLTVVVALVISPLCFARSIATASVLYATWLSIATFVAWMACTAYAHAKGILTTNPAGDSLGPLWQGISVIAFAFTTSFTLPLYAALRGSVQPGVPKSKRANSFKLLSVLSVGLAILLIIPLTFFEATDSPVSTSPFPLWCAYPIPILQRDVQTSASTPFKALVALLNATTLALTIPLVVITAPSVPLPMVLRRTELPVSKILFFIVAIALAMVPPRLAHILSDIVLVSAFFNTYFLPGMSFFCISSFHKETKSLLAFIHIIMHNFRSPLSIVIPPSAPVTPNPAREASSPVSASRDDELLQRKERTLQRRRLTRRIVWDIGVWVLLVPVGGGGLVWAGGRIAGRW